MSAVVIPAQPPRAAGVPQLRTIQLTDLCDSTQLVERLGDGSAADLFRQHDLLVLQLQQQWRGRLIDRSDGMLLLFERPIDGLGFALDYSRGLRDLGCEHQVDLKARAGLHVGEVLTWRNSEEAVKVGAKPLEVEGLAKPMAARLMTMARPGQVLVSAVAEPLAHRSARELGERGQQLLWKSHGRWRFKGLPNPQEIFEVGEAGIAPLRAPKASPKAWRDVPLWRRPAALVAELAVVLGIGLGVWFVTKPQPAIAFNERDWVVVADLRNLTGQPVLDDSLEQAFRISLEQSRYVNVLSDLKARQTLEHMRLSPDTELTRLVASEIAIRDGVRAVILPTVAEVGGHVRVSAEVIDPTSQTTVYTEYADGRGVGSVLTSIDEVTAGLRGKLGEAIGSVEKDSEPLPEVTTANLDALRAYALGVQAQVESKFQEALGFYERAVTLDPEFAMAHLAMARVHAANDDIRAAKRHATLAQELREHLSTRNQLYADAWLATFGPVEPMLSSWHMLAKLYPDYFAGHYNHAFFAYAHAYDYSNIDEATNATSAKNPLRGAAYHLRATLHVGQGDYEEADGDFASARKLGMTGIGFIEAGSLAARFRFDDAREALASVEHTAVLDDNMSHHYLKIAIPLDEGHWRRALENAEAARIDASRVSARDERIFSFALLSLQTLAARDDSLEARMRALLETAQARMTDTSNSERAHAAYLMLATGYLASRAGFSALAQEAITEAGQVAALGYPTVDAMLLTLRAEQARVAGDPELAIKLLQSEPVQQSYQAHVVLAQAYEDAGLHDQWLREARWLQENRGRAYIEHGSHWLLQSMNVADSQRARLFEARALAALGENKEAQKRISEFDRFWSGKPLPDYLRALRFPADAVKVASSM